VRVLESYEHDGLVAFASPWRRLLDDFADHLAGAADKPDLGSELGEWLLERDEVDDVFAEDPALAAVVIEQARRLAAETAAEGEPSGGELVDDDEAELELEPGSLDPEGEAWIARWSRRPFLPKTREGDGPVTASKFCGAALLLPGEEWPVCPGCEQPMRLFVQLDLATVPAELDHPIREGMLQLFYCTNVDPPCEVDHEAWQPFGKSTLARWLSPAEVAAAATRAPAQDPAGELAAVIVGWEPGPIEVPGYEEDGRLEEFEVDEAIKPRPGDKLGGWPDWVQGPQYPRCPHCQNRMRYVLQIESNGLARHQFGDLGAGHLCQCPEHPQVVAFGWACG
jgi:hypothetical protein